MDIYFFQNLVKMFKLYQKYIVNNFIIKFFKISLVFLCLVYLMGILEEINFFKDIEANFFIPYLLTLLNLPITLFEIFPFIIFITTQLCIFDFFRHNELDLLKKNGIKNTKIIKIIFILSFSIGIFNVLFYYNVASKLKFYYSEVKNDYSNDNKYLAMVLESGLWIKDEINNKKYIIKSNSIKESFLLNNIINEFDFNFKLVRTIQSDRIDITGNNWIIYAPIITIDNQRYKYEDMELITNFNNEKIRNLFSDLSSFHFIQLYDLKKEFKKFGYSTDEVDIQLLKLYVIPVFYGILSALSAVIVINFTKNKPLLFHLIFGVTFSVIVYYVNFIFNSLGVNGKIPILLSILFPFFLILLLTMFGLVKINDK